MCSFTIDCPNPYELANFYATLLKWKIAFFGDDFACIGAPGIQQGAYPGITFQRNPNYIPSVCPKIHEAQQQMAHLDFAVNDVEKAVQHAISCGARIPDQQLSDNWTVMLDPVGHPFCLCNMKSMIESNHFSLL